jgi:hypothetical protein
MARASRWCFDCEQMRPSQSHAGLIKTGWTCEICGNVTVSKTTARAAVSVGRMIGRRRAAKQRPKIDDVGKIDPWA